MLYFPDRQLAFLAVPKAASTSVERHLGRFAQPLPEDRFPKHITAAQFRNRWRSHLAAERGPAPETFAIVREPISRLGSWYRYRQRAQIAGQPASTAGISFEAFVLETLKDDPRPFARQVGDQSNFCTGREGEVLVTYLFDYARPDPLLEFIAERFGDTGEMPRQNRSPGAALSLSPETEERLRAQRRREFAFYDWVAREGCAITRG